MRVNLFFLQISDAERFRSEDEKQRERVSAKKALESYCFNMKSATEDRKFSLSDADKMIVMNNCNEMIRWLDSNQMAAKEEYERKQTEISDVCNPIVTNTSGTSSSPFSWIWDLIFCRRSSSLSGLNTEIILSLPYSST